jgi:hypothetical protein
MKLLILTSALDLRLPYGCTSAWWYLFKALYELNTDLLVTVYQGRVVPSPWWSSYENPCYWEGFFFAELKNLRAHLSRASVGTETRTNEQMSSYQNHLILFLSRAIVYPRWRLHLLNILSKTPNVDAVLFINVPLNQLRGIPKTIRDLYNIPTIYYDPDMPVSLPKFQGFATGFRIYEKADLQEYDLFIGNSKGGLDELNKMGARNVKFLPWAVDINVIKPLSISDQDIDVFFYGYGDEYRQSWMNTMLVEPSYRWVDRNICIRGSGYKLRLGNVKQLHSIPFNRLRELCCRSKINLNIGRTSHASIFGSSSMRPYELAALECCMVSNPYLGLEEWFEPGKEMFLLSEPEEVTELYPWLWANEVIRRQVGKLARERVVKEHTYLHRAYQLKQMVSDLIM